MSITQDKTQSRQDHMSAWPFAPLPEQLQICVSHFGSLPFPSPQPQSVTRHSLLLPAIRNSLPMLSKQGHVGVCSTQGQKSQSTGLKRAQGQVSG